jgi:selenide,water dikinase
MKSMQIPSLPIARDIVLIGGGHSHVVVLKQFGMQPEPGVRLTVICTDVHTPYSGMLPGYVSGHYSYDDVHIDLARLAVFAGARLYRDEVIGIDRVAQKVLCRNRPPVPYDCLSINIGSTPRLGSVAGAEAFATPVKPITRFNQRWLALLARVQTHTQGALRIAVVGAGAAGVELVLSMQYRLRLELQTRGVNPDLLEFHLLSASAQILPTHNARVRHRFEQVLSERGVKQYLSADVTRVEYGHLRCANGLKVPADEIMWVTQAGGASWLQGTGLALNEGGFLLVNDQLQSVTDPKVFAVGDIAAMQNYPLEKAGVFAVRMGNPLATNLRLILQGRALKPYHPQSSWLAIISTGNKYAVASRGALGFWGAWVWRWKDWIDLRFMRKFSQFPSMQAAVAAQPAVTPSPLTLTSVEASQAISAVAMRCGGCGAKVGATVLTRALGALRVLQREDVLIGLNDPDDAAVVRVPPGMALVHSVDFFRAFVDDPYLFGKVAANHALGDIFAMGAEPQSTTAIATVPPGLEAKMEDTLFQMMSGAVEVLNAAGCALVGGHTSESQELALGFAVNGLINDSLIHLTRKTGMRPGDAVILTKPIGTGTLFAAHAQLASKGRWIDAALQSMLVSNQGAAQCLRRFGVTACTDVTGFGLLGHLLEMTKPSDVDAELNLSDLPVLDGAEECVAAGIMSSLQPANLRLGHALYQQKSLTSHPRYPLIFDPQTAGGMLASVPVDLAADCVAALHANGYPHAVIIGRVCSRGEGLESIRLIAED